MSLKVAIHQPNLFPRLKVLQKLAYADIWVVLDSVQYCTREYQNRTIIIPNHGDNNPFYLTIPVSKLNERKKRESKIYEMVITNPNYIEYIERTLFHAFHNAKYWKSISALVSNLKDEPVSYNLTELCVNITKSLLQIANKKPALIYSSEIPVKGKSSELIANICRYLQCDSYLADSGSYNYMKPKHFENINVLWQNWVEPTERSENINSWRNISSLNYLSRYGAELFSHHLLNAEFKIDLKWLSQK